MDEPILTVEKFRTMCRNMAEECLYPTKVILTKEARRALTKESFDHWLYRGPSATRAENRELGEIAQLTHPLTGAGVPVQTGAADYVIVRQMSPGTGAPGPEYRYRLKPLLELYGGDGAKKPPLQSAPIRLRVTGGPSGATVRVEDMDTGRVIPCVKLNLGSIEQTRMLTATVEVLIEELDLEVTPEMQHTVYCPSRGTVTLTTEDGKPTLTWRTEGYEGP